MHPLIPLLFWGPVALGLGGWSIHAEVTTWRALLGGFVLGVFVWLGMEYALHRFLFHWEGRGPWSRKFHEILHGYHHRYPDDAQRLMMPLGASVPMAVLVSAVLWTFQAPWLTVPCFCGIVSAYLAYDYTHYYVHACRPRTALGRRRRAHHLAHHFVCPDKNFGITNSWVDRCMGTLRVPNVRAGVTRVRPIRSPTEGLPPRGGDRR
ncbi:sterol desaturase family protein [Pyxidicoccus sp. 3LFB2]